MLAAGQTEELRVQFDDIGAGTLDAVTHVSGAEAVARLSDDLPAVAASYGMSSTDLVKLFSHDQDLLLDGSNQLLYSCSGLEARLEELPVTLNHRRLAQWNVEARDPLVKSLSASPSGVPILHSRPSATLKIYLDFDGHITTGNLPEQLGRNRRLQQGPDLAAMLLVGKAIQVVPVQILCTLTFSLVLLSHKHRNAVRGLLLCVTLAYLGGKERILLLLPLQAPSGMKDAQDAPAPNLASLAGPLLHHPLIRMECRGSRSWRRA
jgi:hypothetical protein